MIDINNLSEQELVHAIVDEINQRCIEFNQEKRAIASGPNILGNIKMNFESHGLAATPTKIKVLKLIFSIAGIKLRCQRLGEIDLHDPSSIDMTIRSFLHCSDNQGCEHWGVRCPLMR
jgi:hypothetical protein